MTDIAVGLIDGSGAVGCGAEPGESPLEEPAQASIESTSRILAMNNGKTLLEEKGDLFTRQQAAGNGTTRAWEAATLRVESAGFESRAAQAEIPKSIRIGKSQG